MSEEFLDILEKVISKIDSVTFRRVGALILWVGIEEEELVRTVNFEFDSSFNIQIGCMTDYFEREQAVEENVLSFFLKILSSEIKEINYYKGKRCVRARYEIHHSKGVEDLGIGTYGITELISSFISLFTSPEVHETYTIYPPVLTKELYCELKDELRKIYSK